MKIISILALLLLTSCSSFHSKQTQTKPDGTIIESDLRVTTFWDAQALVAKVRASTTDKTQGLTVGGLSEASESSNVVSLVERVVGAAIKGAVEGAK